MYLKSSGCEFSPIRVLSSQCVCVGTGSGPRPKLCFRGVMITTHCSLLAFISELQQIRVPCHWANQIKTGDTGLFVLAVSCSWLLITLWRSRTRAGVRSTSALQSSEVIACFASMRVNNRAIQPVGTSFYLLLCEPRLIWSGLFWPIHSWAHSSQRPHTFHVTAPALMRGPHNICTALIFLEVHHYSSSMTEWMKKDISCLNGH